MRARLRLMEAHGLPEEAFAVEVIATSGDRIQDRPLSEAGGKGLFTKELEEALFSGKDRHRRAFRQGHADPTAGRA